MTITEALKEVKFLEKKLSSRFDKLKKVCCELDHPNQPFTFGDASEHQASVHGIQQSIKDLTSEMERLTLSINKTNMVTDVEIQGVTRSIAGWILRRRKFSALDSMAWTALSDRGLQPQANGVENENGEKVGVIVNPKKFYSEKEKMERIDFYSEEVNNINGKLEVVNATTELVSL